MRKVKPCLEPIDRDREWLYENKKDGFTLYCCDTTYFRHPKGRRQWVGQREVDLIDEDGLGCAPRVRDRDKLPDAYDDKGRSRGWAIKSWKEYSRRRKQWIPE